jgi:molecular chaperone Hsp33
MMESTTQDTLSRWLDRSATLRVAAVDVGGVARALGALHGLDGAESATLGELLAGALLLASDLKSAQTLSLQLELGERVFHVDSTPEGLVRAMVTIRSHGSSVSRLAVRRFGHSGLLYQSVVDIPASSVAKVLEGFVVQSEQQVVRFDLVSARGDDGEPSSAFGALVRGFPTTDPRELDELFSSWARRGSWTPSEPCAGLDGRTWDRLSTQEIQHYCPCSRDRARVSVRALGPDVLADAAEKGEPIEVVCDFCRSVYTFGVDEFRSGSSGSDG